MQCHQDSLERFPQELRGDVVSKPKPAELEAQRRQLEKWERECRQWKRRKEVRGFIWGVFWLAMALFLLLHGRSGDSWINDLG
jgi:hypothetical protein